MKRGILTKLFCFVLVNPRSTRFSASRYFTSQFFTCREYDATSRGQEHQLVVGIDLYHNQVLITKCAQPFWNIHVDSLL